MDEPTRALLRQLIHTRLTASLGTVHKGDPFVSMVPYALHGEAPDFPIPHFIIHVSSLSPHTRQMSAHPRVSLMVVEGEDSGTEPQALPRVTVQGEARQLPADDPLIDDARAAYLARFPGSELMFTLGDFSLFAIRPQSVRVVAGFGRAHSLTPEAFAQAMR